MSATVRRIVAFVMLVLVGTAAALLGLPHQALAREYSIPEVNIDATVGADGSLTVVEERTFDFDGSFNGVYWDIPHGHAVHEGQDIIIEIGEVGEVGPDGFVAFEPGSGGSGVYEVNERSRTVEVKLYSKKSDTKATYRISYTVTGGLLSWADCGELYWKFVSDGWDEPSRNVTCDIHLPVPAGEQLVPEGNVRAWGHGPLTGEVTLTDDGAHFTLPKVGTSEFAEARITFPQEWLSGMKPRGELRLQKVIAEETAWADEANARRHRARQLIGAGVLVAALAAVASAAINILTTLRYKRSHKAQFIDTYFRDVPTNDHPSVLGALVNGGAPEGKEFTAALMRLSDQGAVGLDLVNSEGILRKQDYRITRNDVVADALTDEIDRETDYFLFRFLALRCAEDRKEHYDTGFPPLLFKDMKKVAKKYPSSYSEQHRGWVDKVISVCDNRGFFKEESGVRRWPLVLFGILEILIGIAVFIWLMVSGVSLFPAILVPAILVALAVWGFVAAARMKRLSREAIEVQAKLKALKRWLCDFTKLDEAVPGDVVLWNRLLVMSVVLGVSKQVIRQLQMVRPELLEDPDLAPTYRWCVSHGSLNEPSKSFTRSLDSATNASTAELASSSDSSGGGGGGGFSGGGGGGFGGGGGGGAF